MPGEIQPDLRAYVAARAERVCEYCRIHEDDAANRHHVDHIVSRKHGGPSTEDNLAYACVICNRYKGTDIAAIEPRSGVLTRLFHPRQHVWAQHFRLDGAWIGALTPIGEATIRVLKLNAAERVEERRVLQAVGRYPGGAI